jgi:UDP-N-acetylmuramoyl-L-alanyl-D-glutamate--2,6-diaminopimelate ligase
MKYKINELLSDSDFEILSGSGDAEISDIAHDSREAGDGKLFVCRPSTGGADGHDFAGDAYARGSRVFLCEYFPPTLEGKTDITVLRVANVRKALALLAARFYGFPARRLTLVAITGTKGKTTISFLLKSIFEAAGKKVGLIGSGGVFYGDVWVKLPNTTPESTVINRFLKDMADDGVEFCFMETTSQGFLLERTYGLKFDLALFTNISPDHISKTEHENFEHYFKCKKRVFEQTDFCFVNMDAELFDEIIKDAPAKIGTYGFAENADYRAVNVEPEMHENRLSVSFDCVMPKGHELRIHLGIPGLFNASNALAAICVADYFGIASDSIAGGLARAAVKGRMEPVDVPAPYTVIIDFAHNKLSMENLMEAAKFYNPSRILCVFGLEGNRAHIRRFDSGEILGRNVDYTILANASPRTDDGNQILADIATGIERAGGAGKYEIIPDRADAIRKILSMAAEGDLVLLVGKGDVPYEEVNGVNIPFDERAVVKEFFS